MPVQSSAFDAIKGFAFENDAYKSLYDAMDAMRGEYQFYLPPVVDGYYDILWAFYDNSIEILNDCQRRYEAGDGTLDLDALVAESSARMRAAME